MKGLGLGWWLFPVAAGCGWGPGKPLTPCERWQAAVEDCYEQSQSALDTGFNRDTGALAWVAPGACPSPSEEDAEWMDALYTCWADEVAVTDCARRSELVGLTVRIADCALPSSE